MSSSGEGPGPETFAELARSLLAEQDVPRTLQRIVDLAVETIDACDHAGITLLQGGKVVTRVASDDVPFKVDAIQLQIGEGPCLDVLRDGELFVAGDLDRDQRWPRFSSRAQSETGIRSIIAFRLFVDGGTLGALNLYSKRTEAFDDEARATGSVFAAHAAVALWSSLHDEQMEHALASRDLIGQAKGILMAKEGVTAEHAFDMLRRASQRLNVKLRDLAEEVARTGVTPSSPPTARSQGDQPGG